jgi:hypothetical protein
MANPAMILPALALRDGEDFVGVAAAAAFGVEDSALDKALDEGGGRAADKRRILG